MKTGSAEIKIKSYRICLDVESHCSVLIKMQLSELCETKNKRTHTY